MNVGELFVNLGIKGVDKSVDALNSVKKGLGGIGSMSLEAKAAIVGAIYALERLFSASGHQGTNLTNFTAVLGVTAKMLQQYQYAGRQVGLTNDEVEQSFRSLSDTITQYLLTGQMPEGMAVFMNTMHLQAQDLVEMQKAHPELLMQKMQEFAQVTSNPGLRNFVLKSMGMNENMIAGFVRNAFRPDVMSKAPLYSDNEIGALNRANIAWSNLGNRIEMVIGRLNVKYGGRIVHDIDLITNAVSKLIGALVMLDQKFGLFDKFSDVLDKTSQIIEVLSGKAPPTLNDEKNLNKKYNDATLPASNFLRRLWGAPELPTKDLVTPRNQHSGKVTNTTINQNIAHHGNAEDTKAVKDTHRAAINHVMRTSPAQGWGG